MTQGMVVKHCNRLLREATDAPALETFKAKHSKALKTKISAALFSQVKDMF